MPNVDIVQIYVIGMYCLHFAVTFKKYFLKKVTAKDTLSFLKKSPFKLN